MEFVINGCWRPVLSCKAKVSTLSIISCLNGTFNRLANPLATFISTWFIVYVINLLSSWSNVYWILNNNQSINTHKKEKNNTDMHSFPKFCVDTLPCDFVRYLIVLEFTEDMLTTVAIIPWWIAYLLAIWQFWY